MIVEPTLYHVGDADTRAALVWRWRAPVLSLSSAAVRGGLAPARSVLNIGVTGQYARTDLAAHADEVRVRLDRHRGDRVDHLNDAGDGPVLFTAADVALAQRAIEDGVCCDATVGITRPTWAADADHSHGVWRPGTVNLVVQVDGRLTDAALVNAVITATEAKTQAFLDANIAGTGTASDAVVVTCRTDGEADPFGGPRSAVGARVARVVFDAVRSGIEDHP